MRKTSKTSNSSMKSENNLSYLNTYEEISKHSKSTGKVSNKKNNRKPKEKDFILLRSVRWFLFIIFILLQILMNVDHGTIPAATTEIRKDLKIDDDTLGVFGSLVFLGNLIGSLISFSFINWFNRKYLLIVSLLLNSLCLYSFTLTDIVWVLFANRVAVGLFQAFISIYLPVWCDQFGIRNKKTIMISLIQAGSPLGVVLGYFLTSFIKDYPGWEFSFIIQSVFLGLTVLILLFIPSVYFSSTLTLDQTYRFKKSVNNSSGICNNDEVSIYRETMGKLSNDMIDKEKDHNGTATQQPFSIRKNLGFILKQKVYIFSALGLANLLFIVTAVQYWASDYMEQILKIDNKNYRLLSFSIVCVTSPTLGVIFGGWISSRTGGYESKHSILICLIFAICSSICCIPVPLVDGLTEFTILLWLVLFFGGAILSPLTGVIISSLPPILRGSANSITSICSNALGYLPAPYVYGSIHTHFKKYYERIGFMCTMYYSIMGVFFLSLATIFRYREFEKNTLLNDKVHDIDRRRLSSSSIVTCNIAKVFGNYCNIDEGEELKLEQESSSSREDSTRKNVDKVVYNASKDCIEEIADDDISYHDAEICLKRNIKNGFQTNNCDVDECQQKKSTTTPMQTPNFSTFNVSESEILKQKLGYQRMNEDVVLEENNDCNKQDAISKAESFFAPKHTTASHENNEDLLNVEVENKQTFKSNVISIEKDLEHFDINVVKSTNIENKSV